MIFRSNTGNLSFRNYAIYPTYERVLIGLCINNLKLTPKFLFKGGKDETKKKEKEIGENSICYE